MDIGWLSWLQAHESVQHGSSHLAVGEPIVARLNANRSTDDSRSGCSGGMVGKLMADRRRRSFPLGRVDAPLHSTARVCGIQR